MDNQLATNLKQVHLYMYKWYDYVYLQELIPSKIFLYTV